MRSERHNLEDLVGGLVDHHRARTRRATPPPRLAEPREAGTASGTVAIRAAKASAEGTDPSEVAHHAA